MHKIIIRKGKEASLRRFHPWIFSGAIYSDTKEIPVGSAVEVFDHTDNYLATGHFQKGSIMVRVCSFERTNLKQNFWNKKIQRALELRKKMSLAQNNTNCFRLVHGEGDGLPGLVIDLYHQAAVVQCHSAGMFLEREKIAKALVHNFGEALQTIYCKATEALPREVRPAGDWQGEYLLGEEAEATVEEYGHRFSVNWETGQKTGFFLDQRENRQLLARYVEGKQVLNAFCYSGGFSIYALQAGAKLVHSVDISQRAIDLTEKNVSLNSTQAGQHEAFASDVMAFLKDSTTAYEVMVVDPPAFAKSIKKRHNAVQGYKRLNALAMQKIAREGIMFTFSCSQVVDEQLFYNTIVAAAIEARRKVSVLHRLSQAPDHPVSLFHPEGAYLKGLVLYVK